MYADDNNDKNNESLREGFIEFLGAGCCFIIFQSDVLSHT